ncbi:hypothetical protein RchiOBHm_Chr6g0250721 [Rosa chinensis]|uniref:Uncharacterized protein n=1 Tax=Rosa chinensis TaxID=74649 RepID=A0A2P6PKL9_ROSCH|nr:hypothetical protein RchiOBHm_Chr6g0250721 [Rosa chinensis]
MNPTSLYQAYELATIFEEKYLVPKRSQPQQYYTRPNFSEVGPQHRENNLGGRHQTSIPVKPKGTSIDHNNKWSQVDYHNRRARGHCFFCDKPYSGGHVCKKPHNQGRAILIEGVTTSEVKPEEQAFEDLIDMSEPEAEIEEPHIAVQVIGGVENPMTITMPKSLSDDRQKLLSDLECHRCRASRCLLKIQTVEHSCLINKQATGMCYNCCVMARQIARQMPCAAVEALPSDNSAWFQAVVC